MMRFVHLLLPLAAVIGNDPYIRTRINVGADTSAPVEARPCLWWGESNITYNQSDAGNPACCIMSVTPTTVSNAAAVIASLTRDSATRRNN